MMCPDFKKLRILFALFLIPVLPFISLQAQKHYNCYHSTYPPVIDGAITEPEWSEAGWSELFLDIQGPLMEQPRYDTRMKMLWDENALYVAAYLQEPDLWATLTSRDAIVYQDHDFEIFIDPAGKGIDYYEIEVNAFGTILDLFMNKPYRDGGKADLSWDCPGLSVAIELQGTVNDPGDNDTSWTIEAAIPWKAFNRHSGGGDPPDPGATWRMNFSRVEWKTETGNGDYLKKSSPETGKPLPEDNWVWSPQGEINMHIPSQWGYVTFKHPPPRFWFWMGADTSMSIEQQDSVFSHLHDIGIGGLLIGGTPAALQKIIPQVSQNGMEPHAWFWTMNRGDADTSWLSVNAKGHPLSTHKAYVDYYRFMCPALPQVKDFINEKILAFSEVKGLKGIHMDYIRYVDAILPSGLQPKYGIIQDRVYPEYDYGYHPYMRALYKEKTGMDPLELDDPQTNETWLRFRLDKLNETVAGIRDTVREQGLDISSAVFPTPEMARNMVRQEWDRWDLDYYFPMVYFNFYEKDVSWIEEVMAENREAIAGHIRIFCGLYLPALREGDILTEAMEAAMNGGADGIAFFSLNALTQDQALQIRTFIANRNNSK